MDYRPLLQKYVQNVNDFYNALPTSNIHFLYFLKSDLSKPIVKDSFKSVIVASKCKMYLLHGETLDSLNNACFFYAYQESKLKYLVTVMSREPAPRGQALYRVVIQAQVDAVSPPLKRTTVKKGNEIIANHGDHLDIGITANRVGILISTHHTQYTDTFGDFHFTRSAPECNFLLNEAHIREGMDPFFDKTVCHEYKEPVGIVKTRIPDMCHRGTLYTICGAMISPHLTNMTLKQAVLVGGRRRNVKTGKNGGKYVIVKGKKKYLRHRGGAGGITFISTFLAQTMFARVADTRPGLESITVLFDEMNELGSNGNKHIVILYDFVGGSRDIFYLDAAMALTASYVSQYPENDTSNVTIHQREQYTRYMQQIRTIPIQVPIRVV